MKKATIMVALTLMVALTGCGNKSKVSNLETTKDPLEGASKVTITVIEYTDNEEEDLEIIEIDGKEYVKKDGHYMSKEYYEEQAYNQKKNNWSIFGKNK